MPFSGVSRVSTQMMSNMMLSNLQSTQLDYAKVQHQLDTGDMLNAPSDDPAAAGKIMSLDRVMVLNDQIQANLESTMSIFSQSDVALGNAADYVTQALEEAMNVIQTTNPDGTNESSAQIIGNLIDSMLDAANTRVGNVYIFGGTASSEVPFEKNEDGVIYNGTFDARQASLGGVGYTSIGLLGPDAFGMNGVTIECEQDLSPAMSADTRLSDLGGAIGSGIRLGTISITDGTVNVDVDLAGCDRVQDVIDRIDQATGGAITCSIAADGLSFELSSSSPAADITVREYGSGYTARDLGLFNNAGAGATLSGNDVRPVLTEATELSALTAGSGIDLASGLQITNGERSETFIFNVETKLGEVLNRLNNSDMGIEARINSAGDGIEITNLISGSALHIGENGGTTAADLGIRSLDTDTKLADFRDGRGVRVTEDKTDIRITLSNGSTLEVNLDGDITMGDVIDSINDAAVAAGLPVTAAQKTNGNGIEIVDSAGGASDMKIESINSSSAAEDLGINGYSTGGTLTGTDTFDCRTGGIIDNLIRLQDAMLADDKSEMTFVAGLIETEDSPEIISERGRLGALVMDLEERSLHNEDMKIDNKAMRSLLADTDYYEAITRYAQLQTALQASMQTSSSALNMSLLNYLM